MNQVQGWMLLLEDLCGMLYPEFLPKKNNLASF